MLCPTSTTGPPSRAARRTAPVTLRSKSSSVSAATGEGSVARARRSCA